MNKIETEHGTVTWYSESHEALIWLLGEISCGEWENLKKRFELNRSGMFFESDWEEKMMQIVEEAAAERDRRFRED